MDFALSDEDLPEAKNGTGVELDNENPTPVE
jgi:hypothetical protein